MSTHRNTGSTPLRASRIARVVTALGRAVVVGGLATIAACSDAPSAPATLGDATPSYHRGSNDAVTSVLDTPVRVSALLRDEPLGVSKSRSFKVKAHGGVLDWPELGLRVIVPPKAVRGKEIDITVKALAGDVIAYDFGPDGSRFDAPLIVLQSLKGTNYARLGQNTRLRGAYFRSDSQVSDETNTAFVNEFQPTEIHGNGWFVAFKVTHFSGYMVSTD